LPPPPADALIMTGKPMARAIFRASRSSLMTPKWPGTMLTFAFWASFLDSILSPMAAMASAVGPMKTTPAFFNAAAKARFSDRKP
jgi:hypothetical protein